MSIIPKIYLKRIQSLQGSLDKNRLVIFSYPSEVRYLSGFDQFLLPYTREAYLLCSKNSLILLHPHFLTLPKFSFIEYQTGTQPSSLAGAVDKLVKKDNLSEMVIDPTSLFLEEKLALDQISVKVIHAKSRLLTDARMIKDNLELEMMRKAAQITQKVVSRVLVELQPGVTEKDVAIKIDRACIDEGADGPAFPTIVAMGDHTALPHHQPGDRTLTPNQSILIDCGSRYQGYCSDLTRTIWFGDQPDPIFTEVKNVVDQAYQAGLDLMQRQLQAGQPFVAKDLDLICREYIAQSGYKDNFIHTSGHSLGLEIHEQPSISSSSTQQLQPDMTITLEPGIYLPGQFGYRYENTLLIQSNLVEELTT